MNKYTFLLAFSFLFSVTTLSAQQSIAPKEENSLRIMSYNVRNCKGLDEVTDYQRVADVMNRVAPDVIAVQELDSVTERNKHVYTLRELAERTLMHYIYGAAIDYQGGKYGIGILSKEKPLNHRTLKLPGREESRLLLIAEFQDYVVCCTHFSLTEEDQALSVPLIKEALRGINKPVFLTGDMNSVYDSPVQVAIRELFTPLNNYKASTFPVVNPDRCIDFIYGYKNGNDYAVLQRRVLTEEQTASDHLPLFVDVRLKADVSDIMRTKPYLQNPTENGLTISWLTNVPVHSWVEYGTDRNLGQRKENYVDGQMLCYNKHHKIRLENLQPG
ncbi:MAG: endonuclease/exonuclease/phosphatase family protein, partial [Tannerellaceae bacterium]